MRSVSTNRYRFLSVSSARTIVKHASIITFIIALTLTLSAQAKDKASGIDTDILSDTVKPGDNFHIYANQGWFGTQELPPGRAALSVLNASSEEVLDFSAGLIEKSVDAVKRGTASPDQTRISNLYASYIDMEQRNKLGISPLRNSLQQALAITTKKEAAVFMGRVDSHALTHATAWLHPKDSTTHILWLDRMGGAGLVGLPNKDDYHSTQPDAVKRVAAYRDYISQTFVRAGVSDAETRAKAVIELESRLAKGMWNREQLNDREANHRVMKIADLEEYAPGFDWIGFLEASGAPTTGLVNLAQDTAVQHSAAVFAETPVDWWRSYLAFHHIDDYWSTLSEPFDQAGYKFKYIEVHGIESRPNTKARATNFVSSSLRDDIGKLFVEQRFSKEAREQSRMIAHYVRLAMADAFEKAEWMDTTTRAAALEKLEAMRVEIGYPDEPMDYSLVEIDANDLVGNRMRLKEHERRINLDLIGSPYPKGRWFMGAQQVDAAYSPQLNMIIFPAGILQPPMFKANADAAANFGTTGIIFAHEMGHAFDHQGSNFDAFGRYSPWWSSAVRAEYDKRTEKLVRQYCEAEVLPGVKMQCNQMRGEIIADLSGLELAYRAYELFVEDQQNGVTPSIDGLTGRERFFLAREQMARTLTTDEWLERQARESSHPPGVLRSLIPLTNFTPWYEVFGVTEEAQLFRPPADRVQLWHIERNHKEKREK